MISTISPLAKFTLKPWGLRFCISNLQNQILKKWFQNPDLQNCCKPSKFTKLSLFNVSQIHSESDRKSYASISKCLVYICDPCVQQTNKQTNNKHYVNSGHHCPLPFMYWQSCKLTLGGETTLVGQTRNQKRNNINPTNPTNPKTHKSQNSTIPLNSKNFHNSNKSKNCRPPTVQSTEIWDCPKSEFQAHPATDIWISIQIHSCSCHPSLKELKKTKLDVL